MRAKGNFWVELVFNTGRQNFTMEKIWLKNYKPKIPLEITLDNKTLVDMFEYACNIYAHKRAVTCHNVTLSFTEVREQAYKIAQGLADLGVSHGDRVVLILPNSIQYALTVFAILLLGAIIVNINPIYTAAEIEYIIQDSTPKVIVTLDIFAHKLNGISNKYGIEHIITSRISDPYPWLKRCLIGIGSRLSAGITPRLKYKPVKWSKLLSHTKLFTPHLPVNHADIAFIQYTGATTGQPKGAILLHRNIVANIKQIYAVIEPQVANVDEQVVINALPLYHIFSLTANLFTFFFHGAENVMVPNVRNIKDLVRTMNETPFTVFNSLDTLYNKLLECKTFTETAHPYYKYGICGGMATRQSIAETWFKQTGVYPTNCYGLTETSPCVTMSYFDEPFTGLVGYPVPSTEIDIRDIATGTKSLNIRESGLIYVRGPQIMQGYWQNPVETQNVLSLDGWLYTGDIGYINEEGQLMISSRETEMIIVSGFNVYPAEIERVICELPGIKEAAVIGYPDDETYEAVHAFIVFVDKIDKNFLSHDELIGHCSKNLAKYKIPKTITVVNELPRTLVGKIDKKAITANYTILN